MRDSRNDVRETDPPVDMDNLTVSPVFYGGVSAI
jgi:hypothetical protein